jgi:hypothetical protein
MITFITSYDDSTISNHNVVQTIVPIGGINLLGLNASRGNLIQSLAANLNIPVFVLTHGYHAGFYEGQGLIGFSVADINLFINRQVFVYACYTANELGRLSSNQNCIYWGYTGAISALIADPECIDDFKSIFQFIIDEFPNQTNQNSILNFMYELKDRCEIAQSNFDIIGEQDPYYDIISAYSCAKDIWSRMRVFLQNENNQLIHPEAPLGDLFQYN